MAKTKSPRPAEKPAVGTMTATSAEILAGRDGFASLIAIGFPVDTSLDWQKNLQALRMAAKPIEDERDRLVNACALKKGGKVVPGEQPGTIVIDPKQVARYTRDYETIMSKVHTVAVTPVRRSEIPRKVNGKDIIVKNEFDLLGPFLID